MADNTQISWADATWNPLLGCTKVSEGCRNCYAIKMVRRSAGNPNPKVSGPASGLTMSRPDGSLNWTNRVTLVPERLLQPVRWTRPRLIFVNSLSDLFHEDVPDEYIDKVFAVMAMTPQHVYQVLTKRPERMAEWFNTRWQPARAMGATEEEDRSDRVFYAMQDLVRELPDKVADRYFDKDGNYIQPSWPLPNIWIGTSVEHQQAANARIPRLLNTPAVVRFLSCEPLLSPLSIMHMQIPWGNGIINPLSGAGVVTAPGMVGQTIPNLFGPRIDWVIVGGESGTNARLMELSWATDIMEQCRAYGVAFHFKQTGSVWARQNLLRHPKGGDLSELPEVIRVQEYPIPVPKT